MRDNGFLVGEILCGLMMGGRNRHFRIPAQSNTRWEVVAGTDEDATVHMRVARRFASNVRPCPSYGMHW